MKGQDYAELQAPKFLPNLTIEQFGDVHFIHGEPSKEDCIRAQQGLKRMKEVLASNQYNLVVLDEINTSIFSHLVPLEDVLKLLHMKPEETEVVLTGRYAPQEIIDQADLVTEMKEIKHYYNIGVGARVGIEY